MQDEVLVKAAQKLMEGSTPVKLHWSGNKAYTTPKVKGVRRELHSEVAYIEGRLIGPEHSDSLRDKIAGAYRLLNDYHDDWIFCHEDSFEALRQALEEGFNKSRTKHAVELAERLYNAAYSFGF